MTVNCRNCAGDDIVFEVCKHHKFPLSFGWNWCSSGEVINIRSAKVGFADGLCRDTNECTSSIFRSGIMQCDNKQRSSCNFSDHIFDNVHLPPSCFLRSHRYIIRISYDCGTSKRCVAFLYSVHIRLNGT